MVKYQDKAFERPTYRAALLARNIGIVLLLVIGTAAVYPNISSLAMTGLCAVMTLFVWVFHVTADRTMIFNSTYLRDDGEYLYTVVRSFSFGLGRAHFRNKQVRMLRYSCIRRVKRIHEYPFGIALVAEVDTATSREISVDKNIFRTPGAMAELLEKEGQKKTKLFRIERNLTPESEKMLLERLHSLKNINQ